MRHLCSETAVIIEMLTSVPPELLVEIFRVGTTADLRRLSMTSKYLRALALPYIFRDISINFSRTIFEKVPKLTSQNMRSMFIASRLLFPFYMILVRKSFLYHNRTRLY
jgi:hypothetical protein